MRLQLTLYEGESILSVLDVEIPTAELVKTPMDYKAFCERWLHPVVAHLQEVALENGGGGDGRQREKDV